MGLRRLASGLVVAALMTLSGPGRAQGQQGCVAQATAKMRACDARAQATETDKAPVLRGAACTATFDAEVRACEGAARGQQQAAVATRADVAHRIVSGREEMRAIVARLGRFTPAWFEAASDAELDGASADAWKDAVRMRAVAIDLKKAIASDPTVANGVSPPVSQQEQAELDKTAAMPDEALTKLTDGMHAAVDQEKGCRADKKCMGARAARKAEEAFRFNVLDPMCGADRRREETLAAMKREQGNPSGYVDAVALHRFGSDLQYYRDQIAQGAPAFAANRHHAWRGWRVECPATP